MNEIYLYDYTDLDGTNLIVLWLDKDRISLRDRAKFNQKLDSLVRMDFELAIQTKLLARVHKNILKLRIFGEVQLRPMLCRGPVNVNVEYTLLAGAKEIGGRLHPEDVKAVAVARCGDIAVNQGKKHRLRHEPFK